jgi:DNA polymerase alpha subunit B
MASADNDKENMNALFAPARQEGLPEDVLGVLDSTRRIHSISAQELFYKWESYCLKMGPDDTQLDLETARMFQKDIQDQLERGHGNKGGMNAPGTARKPNVSATPRAGVQGQDFLGMLDDMTPSAARRSGGGSIKRKTAGAGSGAAGEDSPVPRKVGKTEAVKSPLEGSIVPFSARPNPGQVLETLNEHIPRAEPPLAPAGESRIKLVANTDIKKFSYRPMAMRQGESSEVLDERIDSWMNPIKEAHGLDTAVFGNAAAQSTNEIVAVGRIACDTPEDKLNASSIVLEMSRREGAGLRVTLDVSELKSYSFFPGQIVALRGTNASGAFFKVKEVLSIPYLPMPVSSPAVLEDVNEKLDSLPLNILCASGPYTADDNLAFEPLAELCEQAASHMVDALVITGPFLDAEHPLLSTGDFDLPDLKGAEADPSSLATLFRLWIAAPLQRLVHANPSITILMVPSTRDAVSKHVSFPQEQLTNKKELGLPRQVKLLPNPCLVSLNEVVVAITAQDVLNDLRGQLCSHGAKEELMSRLPALVMQQRHFYPLFPPGKGSRVSLDVGYSKLLEWGSVMPDVLLCGSVLTPGVKVS